MLIPITILITALLNLYTADKAQASQKAFRLDLVVTGFFGLIHGLGFSNYFRMLMAEEEEKAGPLLGFAAGIEGAQLAVLTGSACPGLRSPAMDTPDQEVLRLGV